MARVRLTYHGKSKYRARLDGVIVRFSPTEYKILERLLLAPPDSYVSNETLIEYIWRNPDWEPELAYNSIVVMINRLRRKGVRIKVKYVWGYRIDSGSREP